MASVFPQLTFIPHHIMDEKNMFSCSSLPRSVSTSKKMATGDPAISGLNALRLGELTEDGLSYKEKFVIRFSEVGNDGTATIETIANLLQEVGGNHFKGDGFSTDRYATTITMRKLHLTWVYVRIHIEVHKYPAWYNLKQKLYHYFHLRKHLSLSIKASVYRSDVVEIESWVQSDGKIGNRRDWIIKDYVSGEVIGRATSKGVMMNEDTRRLQRISDDVLKEYLASSPRTLKLAFPEENKRGVWKILKLEDPAEYSRLGIMPRRSDLDSNNHVNNVTYIGWALEEVGGNHFKGDGFSTDRYATTITMRKLHLTWVYVRIHIEVHKYPAWYNLKQKLYHYFHLRKHLSLSIKASVYRSDVVEIESWVQSDGKIGNRRDWIIKDYVSGEVIGRATSKGVMMNEDTRRLQRISDDVLKEYLASSPRTLKLAFPEENKRGVWKILKLEDPAEYSRLGIMPRRSDLDSNNHVNNVTYIGWALERRFTGVMWLKLSHGFKAMERLGIDVIGLLKTASGEVIGRATSKGVMMNEDTRRLQRVGDDVLKEYLASSPRTLKLAFPEENKRGVWKIAKLEDPAEYSRLGIMPRRSDLDSNNHSIPQEIIDTHELQAITLDYKRECKQGEIVDSLTRSEPLDDLTNSNRSSATKKDEDLTRFIHLLRSADNGLEFSWCRTVWRMKPAKG
ncbi:oleoyl-acyl carrier protein thioesterase [Artemisia annua]|uniref:Acyl-[acyl-carrier-protein] hydrolase n=1 Tax=Artemisia annua TaxID=35608 RepID=A0A2U1Q9P8_ARTAN|nr:oleoyl-acyl carrier protein thioesterase [Artemisia annua]